jgi:diketogulonate reductase-like aldo/keto reductase
MYLPKDANDNFDVDNTSLFNDTWAAMEQLVIAGKAKAIGVSNFSIKKYATHLCARTALTVRDTAVSKSSCRQRR